MLIAAAARRHPLVDAVQTSSLLETLYLVLWVEALNSCKSRENNQEQKNKAAKVRFIIDASKLLLINCF